MKGIILAGGYGSRLGPITKVFSKQLLPVFDKPMIFYPISLMMAAGVTEIIIITGERDQNLFKNLLNDGSQWGISISYIIQENPNGIPEAFLLSEELIRGHKCMLMLGDNIFYGSQIGKIISNNLDFSGAKIYGYLVNDTSGFGTVNMDNLGNIVNVIEKPLNGGSGLAIPGVYHFDDTVIDKTKTLSKSLRGELEIVDLLQLYLKDRTLEVTVIDRGVAWLDTGTIDDLNMASELVRVVQSRQGMLIGSPEEVAYRKGYINKDSLQSLAQSYGNSKYGLALSQIILEE